MAKVDYAIGQARVRTCEDEKFGLVYWAQSTMIPEAARTAFDMAFFAAVKAWAGTTRNGTCPPSPQEGQMRKDVTKLRKELKHFKK